MLASGYPRHADDWYQESRECVDLILDKEPLEGVSWDPSCGEGNIPKAIMARGLPCLASDICDRGFGIPYCDFFSVNRRVDNVVSNPPYGVMQKFVEHALMQATQKVIIVAPLNFLESQARAEFFGTTPLKKVYVSRKRLSMPPGGTGIKAKGGIKAYGWFVWERGHTGSPELKWV